MAKDTNYKDVEFLEYVIKAIVDYPEKVKIERKVDEMGVCLFLKVDPADMGKVLGRRGATTMAIRALLRIVGLKNHARISLKVEEPIGGARPGYARSEASTKLKERSKGQEAKEDTSEASAGSKEELKI